jgi:dihydroorotate dehydrogenase electron transfer subunit
VVFDYRCQVMSHRLCGNGLYVLNLRPVLGPAIPRFECEPGQFVMVDLPDPRFLFRRPFSVLSTYSDGSFDLLYKVVGFGTHVLSHLQPDDELTVLGPLGVGFPPVTTETTLLIGGGIGIAPMYFAGKVAPKTKTYCFYGVRNEKDIGLQAELQMVFGARLQVATDDGSQGFKGHVGQLLAAHADVVQQAQAAYVCGPTPMMQAVTRQLVQMQPAMRVYVSLEEHMPCGIGACTGCVVARTGGRLPAKTCIEGPVLLATDIDWEGTCWQTHTDAAICRP